MSDEISYDPVVPGTTEDAEGKTNQPFVTLSDAEQVATLQQTPAADLEVDPNIEQPSQNPTDIPESDPGAEDEDEDS